MYAQQLITSLFTLWSHSDTSVIHYVCILRSALSLNLPFLSPFLFGLLISFTLSSLKRLRLSHLLIFYICLCWFKKVLKEKELFKIRQQKKQSCKQTNLYSFVSSKFTKRHHCMYLFFELFAMRYLIGDIVGRYHSGPKLIQN